MRFDVRRLFGTADRYADAAHPLRRRLRIITPRERRREALAFIHQYCTETGRDPQFMQQRLAQVKAELKRDNYYHHTAEELAFGARVAWRNHARCIGRLYWQSLEVADCRTVTEPESIAARMQDHLREAYNNGRIRSQISIFKPVEDQRLPATIENTQVLQYAAYMQPDGSVIGDRQNLEATRIAESMGWPRAEDTGPFDRLPLMIRDADDRRSIYPLADDVWREVLISHPNIKALAAMGLKWYAVPVVSNMILSIGGIDYPCAPFNGFYMCTEIASRDFADKKRYDLLPQVAEALGVVADDKRDPLWKDTVLTELNRAVLHSFEEAGVAMVDHHRASEQFMEFYRREQSCGRHIASDWRWVVPPQCSAATDVFHLKMRNYHPVPNFYQSRATDGYRLMPYHGDHEQKRWQRNFDKVARRLRLWRREPW
jgi:nitric-oxide synthase